MTKTSRARYTLEFKQEAVQLVDGGQSIAAVARTLGVVDQTFDCVPESDPDYNTLLSAPRSTGPGGSGLALV